MTKEKFVKNCCSLGYCTKITAEAIQTIYSKMRFVHLLVALQTLWDEGHMTSPCENCKKKGKCPRKCYPKIDYERAMRKKGRKHGTDKHI